MKYPRVCCDNFKPLPLRSTHLSCGCFSGSCRTFQRLPSKAIPSFFPLWTWQASRQLARERLFLTSCALRCWCTALSQQERTVCFPLPPRHIWGDATLFTKSVLCFSLDRSIRIDGYIEEVQVDLNFSG
jgi:hypothetical protein